MNIAKRTCTKIGLLLMLGVLAGGTAQAQLSNNSFEQVDSVGRVKNWTKDMDVSAWFDSLGHSHSDSIIIDHAYYFSTTDAHSGSRAMELRNGYNVTQNTTIAGGVDLVRGDYVYSSIFQRLIPVSYTPSSFGFYYKFLPAGQDTAWALMTVYNDLADEIGTAEIIITNTASSYALISAPVIYSSTEPAGFVSVSFSTAKPNGHATYGTRFLIDDINAITLGIGQAAIEPLICFPTVVSSELIVKAPASYTGLQRSWSIINAEGKVIASGAVNNAGGVPLTIPVASLPAGHYTLALSATGRPQLMTRFIKR